MSPPRHRVGNPPPQPLVLFDDDCPFCRRWAGRWRSDYAGRLKLESSQSAGRRFPEIPASAYAVALQLVEPDGSVYTQAHAVLRARSWGRAKRGVLLPLYESVPGVSALLDFGYRIVARHRRVFSMLMGG